MDVIIAEEYKGMISDDYIKEITAEIESVLNLNEVDYSIVFESDSFVKKLNNQYRGINTPTDVLSFEANIIDPFTHKKYLGDIVISVPTVQKQAKEREIALNDEISIIVVHGILHLLGMDHSSEQSKKEMWGIQQQLLQELNVDSAAYPQ